MTDEYIDNEKRRPRTETALFVIVCATAMLATILFGAVDNITWVLLTAIWMIAMVLWLVSGWRNGLRINTSSIQLPLIGLLLIGIIQMLPLVSRSFPEISGGGVSAALSVDPFITRLFVLKLAVFILFFGACLTELDSQKRLKTLVTAIIVFGSVLAFYGILQRLADPGGIYGLRDPKQAIPFGPFVNQHHFAALMQMTGGLAVAMVFSDRISRNVRVLAAAGLAIMGAAAMFTSSRGGLIGFAAMVAFVPIFKIFRAEKDGRKGAAENRSSKFPVIAGVAGIAIVMVTLALFLGGGESLMRGTGVVSAGEDVSSGRFHFWPIAVQIFLANPIIGAGFDGFGYAYTQFDSWSGQFRVEQAHNDYLQILADAGILGFVCIAAFIVLLFKKGLTVINNSRGTRRAAAIGALAGCFGVMLHSFFDFPLRTFSNSFFFLMLAAIATVNIPDSGQSVSRRHRT